MIDGHCHLNRKLGSCSNAIHDLYITAHKVGVKGILLLNLPELNFDNDQVLENVKIYDKFFRVFPSVKPCSKLSFEELKRLKVSGASGSPVSASSAHKS